MPETHFPVMIMELGELQVYGFLTQREFDAKMSPKEIFWRYKNTEEAYGPFMSMYQATQHYSWIAEQKKIHKNANKLIEVDFIKKKRK